MDSYLESLDTYDQSKSISKSLEYLKNVTNIIDRKDIELPPGRNLGSGAYGVVRKAVYRRANGDDIDCAVKIINSAEEISSFKNEVHQLSRIQHENIVKIYGACIEEPCYLVLEYASGGSLYNVLHIEPYLRKIQYSLSHALSWCLQCIRGVNYLHTMKPKPLIHRDLKPPNLLLIDGMLILKICDFGTACPQQTNMTNAKGSAAWMAPEVVNGRQYTAKCDIFSWGIILWEILSRQKPYEHLPNAFSIMWAINSNIRPPLLDNVPKVFTDLMRKCWQPNPSLRPTSTQVMEEVEMLFSYCDKADLTPLSCPIPLRSSSSSSTISSDISFTQSKTPMGTILPIAFTTNDPTNRLLVSDPNEPSTSRQSSMEPQKSTTTFPRHRRQLSADLNAVARESVTPPPTPRPLESSLPVSRDTSYETTLQSHLWIEPRLQPLPPLTDCPESLILYENHRKLCQQHYTRSLEIQILQRRSRELDKRLLEELPTRKTDIQTIYEKLYEEHNDLVKMEEQWKEDVRALHRTNQTEDDWVLLS